ncbi:MAG TPA: shikimate dehydrogenase [Bacteroidia bacterium]|jgi:shikimate dehydrogenase|nr:shikimate dehydrogenase [Bacteroidia bacterium]
MPTYGLIGFPLSHSFSQKYFTDKFLREGIAGARYELFPIEHVSAFPDLLKAHPDLCGLNVTIPHKESILPFLNELDPVAAEVQAVNTIRITKNAKGLHLKGFNTDTFGFRQSIKPFLESHHERALILGTGGASKAVAWVLKEIGVDCYFVSRQGASDSGKKMNVFRYEELNDHVMKHFPLIINTTPIGMFPDTDKAPAIPYEFIGPRHFLYDLIYNPAETFFLAEGRKRGAQVLNGLSMLQQQAEKAWEIWNS